VHDNQAVAKGDLLFTIDRERFALALQQAQAIVPAKINRNPPASQPRAVSSGVHWRSCSGVGGRPETSMCSAGTISSAGWSGCAAAIGRSRT